MRCASHGADRIRPSAIQPTGAEALPGEDDRSDGRDGLVTEGEPQAGESVRVVRGRGGERYEKRHHPWRGGERVPVDRGPWAGPHDAGKAERARGQLPHDAPLPSLCPTST